MRTWGSGIIAVSLMLATLALAQPAAASRDAGVAALQVALHARGLYSGSIDGLRGPQTTDAVVSLLGRTIAARVVTLRPSCVRRRK